MCVCVRVCVCVCHVIGRRRSVSAAAGIAGAAELLRQTSGGSRPERLDESLGAALEQSCALGGRSLLTADARSPAILLCAPGRPRVVSMATARQQDGVAPSVRRLTDTWVALFAIHASVCLSVCLSFFLSVFLPFFLSVFLSFFLSAQRLCV